MTDTYTTGLVVLYNLAVALDEARALPQGSVGFPVTVAPLDYVLTVLRRAERELCPKVQQAAQKAVRRDG